MGDYGRPGAHSLGEPVGSPPHPPPLFRSETEASKDPLARARVSPAPPHPQLVPPPLDPPRVGRRQLGVGMGAGGPHPV